MLNQATLQDLVRCWIESAKLPNEKRKNCRTKNGKTAERKTEKLPNDSCGSDQKCDIIIAK